jgi:hypothetical protein
MRPYDDGSDEEQPSYAGVGKRGGTTADGGNQRAGGSNRGAMKFLAANAGMRAGAHRDTK